VVVANNRGRNLSICAAMSEEGFLLHKINHGAYTALLFCEFLESLFEKLVELGRRCCWIVLDNVRFHHCANVAECATRFGHQLVFLPPYSPMLNLIESLFGKWKTSVRSRHVTFTNQALLESIESARLEITVSDCLVWIRDANRNLVLSLQNHYFD
jgi:transposase